jgi:AcrR family transcriptional regulator
MARPIGEELDEKRRTQILEAALYCFLTFDFGKTSMDDIANRAGVSRPLIYLKFKNKDELFAGVFDYLTAGTASRRSHRLPGECPIRPCARQLRSELLHRYLPT